MWIVGTGNQIADDGPLKKMQRRIGMFLWHGGYICSALALPRPESSDGNHGHEVHMAGHDVFITYCDTRRGLGWRGAVETHHGVGGGLVGLIGLKEDFDAVETLENQLVAGVELDSWLAVDAVGAELDAETAFWLVPIATGLS